MKAAVSVAGSLNCYCERDRALRDEDVDAQDDRDEVLAPRRALREGLHESELHGQDLSGKPSRMGKVQKT